MGKIIISEFVSVDGVIEDPSGAEGFERGGWVGHVGRAGREAVDGVKLEEALAADALLLGRRTYEFFAARWPSRSGELADRLNGLPKYVVSSTLEQPDWSNSTVLRGDPLHEIARLRRECRGEIVVFGSLQLVRMLIEHDVFDELRLMSYPIVLGAGERLFGETGDKKPMRLAEARAVGGGGVALLRYERASG
jgi:dihydrofolate reductase